MRNETLTGLTGHPHPERGTLSMTVGEGPASAPSLPPTAALRRIKEHFLPAFRQVFQPSYSNVILIEKDLKTPGILSASWHFLAHRTLRILLWGPSVCQSMPSSL